MLGSTLHCTATPARLSCLSLMRIVVEVVVGVVVSVLSHSSVLSQISSPTLSPLDRGGRPVLGRSRVRFLALMVSVQSTPRDSSLCSEAVATSCPQKCPDWPSENNLPSCWWKQALGFNYRFKFSINLQKSVEKDTKTYIRRFRLFLLYETNRRIIIWYLLRSSNLKFPFNYNQPSCSCCLFRTVANNTACYQVQPLILC